MEESKETSSKLFMAEQGDRSCQELFSMEGCLLEICSDSEITSFFIFIFTLIRTSYLRM